MNTNENTNELLDVCVVNLSKELPVLRKLAGLTQLDLAEVLDVSRQTITNIESGATKMRWFLFLAIMFIFSLDERTSEYLKIVRIRYSELKKWLKGKCGEELK